MSLVTNVPVTSRRPGRQSSGSSDISLNRGSSMRSNETVPAPKRIACLTWVSSPRANGWNYHREQKDSMNCISCVSTERTASASRNGRMKFDDLDAKMRRFETAHDHCVLPGIFMVARIDGRGFTRLTKEV